MNRITLDAVLVGASVLLAIGLLIAGGLLVWAHNFVEDHVRFELAQQRIYFPPAGSEALASPDIGPYLTKYAGQQLLTGDQAKDYADHFINVHLQGVADGQTYAEVSAKAQADPGDATLASQADTLFRGETLRGLLLEAYGFWTFGQIAYWGAVASFALAGITLVVSVLGLWYWRRVHRSAEA